MKKTIIILGVLILISCNSKKSENVDKQNLNKIFLENIETTKVILTNQVQELILTGKVECDPDKLISYVPLISGVVNKTYFSLGDKVQKDQPLLDVRSTEFSVLQTEKISLEAEEKIAERELKATQAMFDANMLTEKELMEVRGKLTQIRAAISRIKADMSVYGDDKGNGIFTVNAQMSGFVVHKKASQGTAISTDYDAVFTIADLSTVWITVNVYAGNLLFVREGMEVEMTTLSYPDEIFYGKINVLSQVFDPEEKVLKARIIMKNNELKLKPEMSMLIKLKRVETEHAMPLPAIPSDALIFDANQYFVVVEETPQKFLIRKVILAGQHNKVSYISSGLCDGETIVVKNQLLIYSGLKEE
ncbi:MAG: efflux RND transporter periplasmic adaptor subunit [Bacteroidales bacterium]|jgi:cobalt-zinc-cadmium efflux system membrane fusion protein|nr:efflux RND transporter periplasmic adaptor subunit [Bacteroidales bacterium]